MEANNMKAMREAYEFAEEFLRDYGTDWKLHNKLCDMLKSALAAPLRNCDVGSDKEQYKRFRDYCSRKRCENLITPNTLGSEFAFEWAQMPYAEGGAK